MIIYIFPDSLHIENIAIDKAHQIHGYGTLLMQHVIAVNEKEYNKPKISLCVELKDREGNVQDSTKVVNLISFYKKLGYVEGAAYS
jgi:ribosomal protein S18 acetylase RimI-like enzyme